MNDKKIDKGIRMGALTKDEGACYRVPKDCMKCAGEFYVYLQLIRCLAKKSLMKCVRKNFNRERVFVKGDIVDILTLPWNTMDTIEGDVWLIVNKSKKDQVTSWKRKFDDVKDCLVEIEVITKPYPIKEMAMIYSQPRHKPSDPMIQSLSVYLDDERYIYIDSTIFPIASAYNAIDDEEEDKPGEEKESSQGVITEVASYPFGYEFP